MYLRYMILQQDGTMMVGIIEGYTVFPGISLWKLRGPHLAQREDGRSGEAWDVLPAWPCRVYAYLP